MKKRNIIAAVAMAVAASGFSATAFAAKSITYTTTTAQYSLATDIATTPANAKVVSGAAVVVNIAGTAGTSGLVAGDKVTFTLAGGAKFDATTLAANLPVIAGLGAFTAATTTAITNAASFANSCILATATPSLLTCTVQGTTDNNATAANNALTITLPVAVKYDMTSATADTTITASVNGVVLGATAVKQSDATTVTTASKTIETVNAAEQAAYATNAGATKQATVADLFKIFGAGANPAAKHDVVSAASTISTKGSTYTPTGYFLYTVSGLPAAAKSVNSSVAPTGAVDAAGAAKTAQTGGNFWLDGNGNAFAKLAAGATVVIPVQTITIAMNGTAPITATDITMGITYVAGTNDNFKSHVVSAPSTLGLVTRDGSSFSINRMAPQSTVRLSNLSGANTAPGTITVVAKNAAGTVIANTATAAVALPTTVTSGKSVTISGATFQADFPGAVTFDFTVAAKDVLVSHRQAVPGVGLTTTTFRSSGSNTSGGL